MQDPDLNDEDEDDEDDGEDGTDSDEDGHNVFYKADELIVSYKFKQNISDLTLNNFVYVLMKLVPAKECAAVMAS